LPSRREEDLRGMGALRAAGGCGLADAVNDVLTQQIDCARFPAAVR